MVRLNNMEAGLSLFFLKSIPVQVAVKNLGFGGGGVQVGFCQVANFVGYNGCLVGESSFLRWVTINLQSSWPGDKHNSKR